VSEFLRELFGFLRERKSIVLVPLIGTLLLLAALLIFHRGSPSAPFVYTLF